MIGEVIRYNLSVVDTGIGCYNDMVPDPEGDYIEYEEYRKLSEEFAELLWRIGSLEK